MLNRLSSAIGTKSVGPRVRRPGSKPCCLGLCFLVKTLDLSEPQMSFYKTGIVIVFFHGIAVKINEDVKGQIQSAWHVLCWQEFEFITIVIIEVLEEGR